MIQSITYLRTYKVNFIFPYFSTPWRDMPTSTPGYSFIDIPIIRSHYLTLCWTLKASNPTYILDIKSLQSRLVGHYRLSIQPPLSTSPGGHSVGPRPSVSRSSTLSYLCFLSRILTLFKINILLHNGPLFILIIFPNPS